MFKVIIVGGQETENYDFFKAKCIACLKNRTQEGIMIYSTGDTFVDVFAKRYGINVRIFDTDWKTHGKQALKERNEMMLSDCDAVIVFRGDLKDNAYILKMASEKQIPFRNIRQ